MFDIVQSSFQIPCCAIDTAYNQMMRHPKIWEKATEATNFTGLLEKFGLWALKDKSGDVYKLHAPKQLGGMVACRVFLKELAKHCKSGSYLVMEDDNSRTCLEFRDGCFFEFELDPSNEIEVDFGM